MFPVPMSTPPPSHLLSNADDALDRPVELLEHGGRVRGKGDAFGQEADGGEEDALALLPLRGVPLGSRLGGVDEVDQLENIK